jgi:T5SS/PEP-CTERM-associated repeat protein
MKAIVLSIAIASMVLTFSGPVMGQQTVWISSTGSWFVSENWTNDLPGGGIAAVINNGGMAQIFSTDPPGAGAAALVLGGSSGTEGRLELMGGTAGFGGLFVGKGGSGELQILDGAVVSSEGAAIGEGVDAGGMVTVDGSGSRWTNSGHLTIGASGAGELEITNGAEVAGSKSVNLGYAADSSGTLTVSGAGSMFTNSDLITVGSFGIGQMSILNGGVVSTGLAGIIGAFAPSTVTIDGPGSAWMSGGLNIQSGSMTIRNGGAVAVTSGAINNYIGSGGGSGAVTVTGAGSTWTHSGALSVGDTGFGEVEILDGAIMTSSSMVIIAERPRSRGTVTVDGAGSMLTINNTLDVGDTGMGELRILNGAKVSNTDGTIARVGVASGAVTVDGIGSVWTNTGGLRVADEGIGELNILNGATVSNSFGAIICANGANGGVTVDGAGSKWTISDFLEIGFNGRGTLHILNGGTVSNKYAHISGRGGPSSVTVDGIGSMWTNTGNVTIGSSSPGTLRVQNGGVVSAPLVIVGNGTLSGDGTVVANVLNNVGIVAPGTSPGTLDITGNYTQGSMAQLQIELASASSFGKLDVSGNVLLNGTLNVSLTGGFVPLENQSFAILDWGGSLSGGFASIQLPTLGGSLTWDTSQLHTTGVLSIAAPAAEKG